MEFREILTGLMNRPQPEQETAWPESEYGLQEQNIPQKQEEMHEEEHEQKLTWGMGAEETSGILITGRMTLRQVQDKTGLSGRAIADRLGLPARVFLDEYLSRLRRNYGFTLQEIRDIVSAMLKKLHKASLCCGR